jgi:predicted DNA-binding transcriptional regulator AlpA
MHQDKYLTASAVSELSTLSRATIERKVRTGDFPRPIYISARRKVFKEGEVRAWMAAKEQPAA